jgi:hypothetical protein
MALSVGGIGGSYGMSYVQPMNYTIKNESEVSDAFLQNGVQGAVPNVSPVGYPNAQAVSGEDEENDPLALAVNSVKKSREASRMYNDLAAKFQGMTTGYTQQSAGLSYGTAGSNLDVFA